MEKKIITWVAGGIAKPLAMLRWWPGQLLLRSFRSLALLVICATPVQLPSQVSAQRVDRIEDRVHSLEELAVTTAALVEQNSARLDQGDVTNRELANSHNILSQAHARVVGSAEGVYSSVKFFGWMITVIVAVCSLIVSVFSARIYRRVNGQ